MTGFKIQTRIQAWLLTAAFMLVPGLTQAQAPTKAQQDAIRSNCRSDYMKNCSSVTPGGREALECLMRNKASVSGGCQGALNAVSAPAAAKPEPKAEPAAPPPSQAPAAAAPHAPEAPKAPPPAAARPAAPKAAKTPARPAAPPPAEAAAPPPPAAVGAPPPPADAAPRPMRIGEAIMIRRFCANDFKVLCKGVPIGQGRAVKCLEENRPALSPGCKQAMADTGH